MPLRATLILDDGNEFEGFSFGAPRSVTGEVVFTTGMVGYPQSLTDPSYRGQILVSTYPLAGNYGVPPATRDAEGILEHFESERVWISGLVVTEPCDAPSHRDSERSLSAWLADSGVPGIWGLDTRAITKILRERGTMAGSILVEGCDAPAEDWAARNPVAEVSCSKPQVYSRGGLPRIALLDCGVKNNILRCLLARGAEVTRLPWNADLDRADCDGVVLSNGPGDPKACAHPIAAIRRLLEGDRPLFGICLGAQLLALAAGADTYKLRYGHRGHNQPCIELGTRRCTVTSQNHGYAIRADSLPPLWEPWFVNGNDGTIEGIRSSSGLFEAVQFHPEGCPGPRDNEGLFDRFIARASRASTQKRGAA